MAKEFKKAAAVARPVYNTIIGSAQVADAALHTQEVQETQYAQETPHVEQEQGTQGRKGQKMPRINMAFSQENLDYLRVMAALHGKSITSYVNALIQEDRAKNTGSYEAAKQLSGTAKQK